MYEQGSSHCLLTQACVGKQSESDLQPTERKEKEHFNNQFHSSQLHLNESFRTLTLVTLALSVSSKAISARACWSVELCSTFSVPCAGVWILSARVQAFLIYACLIVGTL